MSKLKLRLLDKKDKTEHDDSSGSTKRKNNNICSAAANKKSPGFAAVKFRNQVHKFMTKITVRPGRFVKAVDVKHVTKVAVR